MKRIGVCLFFVFIFLLSATWPALRAQQNPQITTFDAAGAGSASGQGTAPRSINSMGEITGEYYDSKTGVHGFLRAADGTISTLDVPGAGTGNGQGTFPKSINSVGEIAGFYYDADHLLTRGFVRSADGTITTFDAALPLSVNSGGRTTGAYSQQQGFVRERDGDITSFQAGPKGTYPQSINSIGQVTGWYVDANFVTHGFVRNPDGRIITFDAGPKGTYPQSISSLGVITGWYVDAKLAYHGFLRNQLGIVVKFDACPNGTYPQSINSIGQITGHCFNAGGSLSQGFVRQIDGHISMFAVPGAAGPYSGDGTVPQGIDDRGDVTGFYTDATGAYHGFLRANQH